MLAHVKIALTMSDGSLCVLAFATQAKSPSLPFGAVWMDRSRGLWSRAPTPENIAAELSKAFGYNPARPTPVSYELVNDDQLPKQRDYRNAWELKGGTITENLDKAKELHRDKLRNQRTALLLPLDVEWSRAMATDDKAAAQAIEAQRQELRDITEDPRIDAAVSVDELRAITV